MRYGEFRRNVYDRLGEDFDAPARYPSYLVYEFLREACEQWCATTGGNVKTSTISLVASTMEYQLPGDVVQILEVMGDRLSIPLTPIHWAEMYINPTLGSRPWRDINDVRPWHYIPVGFDRIWIWPTQTTVAASDTVTVTYSSSRIDDLDAAMSSDDEDINVVPRELHDTLVDYVVGRLLMIGARDDNHIGDAKNLVHGWLVAMNLGGSLKGIAGADAPVTPFPILNK